MCCEWFGHEDSQKFQETRQEKVAIKKSIDWFLGNLKFKFPIWKKNTWNWKEILSKSVWNQSKPNCTNDSYLDSFLLAFVCPVNITLPPPNRICIWRIMDEHDSVKSENSGRSRRSRSHGNNTSHSQGRRSHRNKRSAGEIMAPFQTSVNITGRILLNWIAFFKLLNKEKEVQPTLTISHFSVK